MKAQTKIVFSSSPGSAPKQKFKTSEFIYGRLEFGTSIKDYFNTDGEDSDLPKSYLTYDLNIFDSQEDEVGGFFQQYLHPTNSELSAKRFYFDVYPEPSKASTVRSMIAPFTTGFSVPFSDALNDGDYQDGEIYKVKVKIYRGEIEVAGEFALEYHDSDISAVQKNRKEADQVVQKISKEKETADRGLPKEWNMVSAKIESGDTEAQLKKIFLSQEPASTEIMKVVVLPARGDWNIYRNEKTVEREILFRWFDQRVVFFSKRDGKYFYANGGVRQDYNGDGSYGKSYLKWEEKYEVSAQALPKP